MLFAFTYPDTPQLGPELLRQVLILAVPVILLASVVALRLRRSISRHAEPRWAEQAPAPDSFNS